VDKALLTDPTRNTQALLDAFTAADEGGVSAAFLASQDGSGDPIASVVLSEVNTAVNDGTGQPIKPAGTNSVRFEGFLEVPVAGAYRFYAALSKKDAEAELRFAHLPDPVFSGKAAQDNDELGKGPTEFVELKPGTPHRFTFVVRNLNGGDAQLRVQGETLPKDSLARLTLYAETSVERSRRAQLLLAKTLQLVQALNLNERELRYILSHSADFDGISLSALPTIDNVQARANAATLFKQFLRLSAYSRLKRDLAGGADDLINVFEAANLDDAYARVARIARREKDVVKAIAESMFSAPVFANEQNLSRLWDGLQVVELFGVPAKSIASWTEISKVPATPADHLRRAKISRDLKDTIKGSLEAEAWLRVAQPIFDKLRKRQRDALVGHVMHQHRFDRIEQLFEFFLIDPGVEPVVQTSRIRSAIAAVQIFINRALLNLEPQVAPAAINSKQWQWMKRYPVWAGNRKLWLFPENVLEPEFRDDKTHLFTELEGKLLQGDVTTDVVEDAFFNYLKKLDELARLDIVAMYCEEQPLDPASNQLHVIGRTYLEPHKYFYRRYAHQMWTPWEPMPVEIEGNHIVPVIWRDRLNVFWVTFIDNPDPAALPADENALIAATTIIGATLKEATATKQPALELSPGAAAASTSGKKITELSVGQLAGAVRSAVDRKLVKVQLHWSEYFQGEWSVRESGGYSASLIRSVSLDFDSTRVFIHATKDFEDGEERGVRIHLGGEINQAFHVVSRNSRPTATSRAAAPRIPYNAPTVQANRYAGQGPFKVTFAQRVETEVGQGTKTTLATPDILGQGGSFTLLPCANTITIGTEEIALLVTPVFYQDDRSNTFYIEPSLKEQTIEEWQEWITRTPAPEVEWDDPKWWGTLLVEPLVPKVRAPVPVNPRDPIWQPEIDPRARFKIASKQDWLANPTTVIQFDGELVGPKGHAGLTALSAVKETEEETPTVNINAGSAIAPDNAVVVTSRNTLASAGLTQASGGLNVIGGNGLNSALLNNTKALKSF
jgi:hypothetical protein